MRSTTVIVDPSSPLSIACFRLASFCQYSLVKDHSLIIARGAIVVKGITGDESGDIRHLENRLVYHGRQLARIGTRCYTHSMFIARVWHKDRRKAYWVLKASVWDKNTKRQRQVYLGYVGPKREITEAKAQELAEKASEKLGRPVTVEQIKKVRRLKVIPDEPANTARKETEPEALTLESHLRTRRPLR